MKKIPNDRNLIEFNRPDITNTVNVYRRLPDNTKELIGKIYPDMSKGEDSITYISVNKLGEEIIPPTTDFTEIENRFNKYAKELSEQSFIEELKAESETYSERKESITSLRNWNKKEIQQINR